MKHTKQLLQHLKLALKLSLMVLFSSCANEKENKYISEKTNKTLFKTTNEKETPTYKTIIDFYNTLALENASITMLRWVKPFRFLIGVTIAFGQFILFNQINLANHLLLETSPNSITPLNSK